MKTAKKHFGSGRKKLNTLRQSNRKNIRSVRSFGLKSINNRKIEDSGRYLATTPKAAASKAFTHWCRENKKKEECAVTIKIYEKTKGNPHKEYTYNALRRPADSVAKYRGKKRSEDVEIIHKYTNVLYTTEDKPHSHHSKSHSHKKK